MTMTDPRLDRLVQFDPRSRAFPVRALIAAKKPRSYTWRVGTWMDQGREGQCVAYAWAHELSARPVMVNGLTTDFTRDVYWRAQQIDEWEGGEYPGASPRYAGTSVLAGAKVIKSLGYIQEYRWAFSLEDLRLTIGYRGPAVLGLNWYEGMFDTDADGYIRPTGELAGGHAILAYANSERHKRISLWNSWGRGFGRDGMAYISYDDLDRLLHEQGEACVPVVRAAPKQ